MSSDYLPATLGAAQELIAARSENPPGDERSVADVAERLLRQQGITDVRRLALETHRPNLIARVEGRRPGATLALCGHLDTKAAGPRKAWQFDPFAGTVHDDRLYGLGAADMKGAVAAMIVAVGQARAAGVPEAGTLMLVLTADEEGGSTFGAGYLATSRSVQADAMLIGEPAGVDCDWEAIYTSCRGVLLFKVDITGAGGHSSLAKPENGPSPTVALADLVQRLDKAFHAVPGLAVNVAASLGGGIGYGVLPMAAWMRGDVRIPPGVEGAEVLAVLQSEVDQARRWSPHLAFQLSTREVTETPIEPYALAPDHPLEAACRAACAAVLGEAPPVGVFPGGTDAYFFGAIAGIPTVSALGPGRLRQAHQPDEFVTLESLAAAPAIYLEVARRFLGDDA